MTVRRLLLIALLRASALTLAVVLVAALGHAPALGTLDAHSVPQPTEVLLAEHGCWSGQAPAGVTMPGHVVAARPGQPYRYYGPRVTGEALEQVFGHRDHHLRVAGFCR